MRKLRWSSAVVFVLSGAVLAAPQTPTFRSQSNYVEVDAIVTDGRGAFVPGLTARDFDLRENSASQPIAAFSYIDLAGGSAQTAPIAFRDDLAAAERVDAARIYLLYIGTAPEYLARAKAQARQFVLTAMQPGDVALLWQTRANSPMVGTSDKADLIRQIDSFSFGQSASTAGAAIGAQPSDLKQAIDWMSGLQGRRKSMVLFSSGALSLAAFPNWRGQNLHWLTGRYDDGASMIPARNQAGVRIPVREVDYTYDLGDLMARADVAIYPCDVRGVIAPYSEGGPEGLTGDPTVDAAVRVEASYRQTAVSTDGLQEIATRTGGVAIINTNNPAAGFKRIVDDNTRYYLLGYDSSAPHLAGEFRRLDVRVKRPGLVVRARQGYISR